MCSKNVPSKTISSIFTVIGLSLAYLTLGTCKRLSIHDFQKESAIFVAYHAANATPA